MGAIHFSVDRQLIELLKEALDLRVFVETGTFEGETLDITRGIFERNYSVEISEEYFRRAKKRFSRVRNVKISKGNSASFIRDLSPKLSSLAVLYWLDAHWCAADDTGGEDSQCPLLEELSGIGRLEDNSLIMIDDARLFLCTPCAPHKISQWPTFQEILDQLRRLSAIHKVMVLNDVIFFYPPQIADLLGQYAHEHGVDWLHQVNRAKRADEMEKDHREQQAVLEYCMQRALDIPKDREDLWEQLVEKEAVIQGLLTQITNERRRIAELKSGKK